MLLKFAGEAGLGDYGDGDASKKDAYHDTDEWQGADTAVPAASFLEGDRIGFEEEVENAINQSHVYRDKEKDRLFD